MGDTSVPSSQPLLFSLQLQSLLGSASSHLIGFRTLDFIQIRTETKAILLWMGTMVQQLRSIIPIVDFGLSAAWSVCGFGQAIIPFRI